MHTIATPFLWLVFAGIVLLALGVVVAIIGTTIVLSLLRPPFASGGHGQGESGRYRQ
jgi:hypothetical protein